MKILVRSGTINIYSTSLLKSYCEDNGPARFIACGGDGTLNEVLNGFININIIRNVSRHKFLHLFPYYMKGSFLELKNIQKVIHSEKCSKVKITPLDDKMRLCVDGEIIDAGKTEFEICHNTFNFVVPQNVASSKIAELLTG